jgi:anti-anti-sigma regulatory factor/PHD/YefM family antitoxin component YafN of YafNO toxin-antitoxin module
MNTAISHQQFGPVDIFWLEGSFETAEEELNLQLAESFALGSYNIVLDLSKLVHFGDRGLRPLLDARDIARKGHGDVRLAGMSARIRRVFVSAGISSEFNQYDDVAQAIASFSVAAPRGKEGITRLNLRESAGVGEVASFLRNRIEVSRVTHAGILIIDNSRHIRAVLIHIDMWRRWREKAGLPTTIPAAWKRGRKSLHAVIATLDSLLENIEQQPILLTINRHDYALILSIDDFENITKK